MRDCFLIGALTSRFSAAENQQLSFREKAGNLLTGLDYLSTQHTIAMTT